MIPKYEMEYLYLTEEIAPRKIKDGKQIDEEKRVEIIQVFGEEQE